MRVRPLWALFLLGACAHAAPAASPARGSAPMPAGASCVAASVVVLRDTGTASAVDPVETQREIFNSDTFHHMMERGAPGVAEPVALKVHRQGKSAVLRLAFVSQGLEAALGTCNAALDAAFAFGKEALEFLQQQQRALQTEHEAKAKALADFEEKNDLVVLPVSERLSMAREKVREIGRALEDPKRHDACKPKDDSCRAFLDHTLQSALARARVEASDLNERQLEWQRLKREAEETLRRVEMLRARLGEATLSGILQQDLRVLDRCGACR